MEFNWIYDHRTPRKLRSALKMYGVSSSLLKVAIYHGGKMQINENSSERQKACVKENHNP